MSDKSLITIMNEQYSRMSKGQKKLATFITDHLDRAAFLTADRLGEAAGVSESTVVRFAAFLGFSGYAQLAEHMAQLVHRELVSGTGSGAVFAHADDENTEEAMLRDIQLMAETREKMDDTILTTAANMIANAAHVYIVGIRSCSPLSEYLGYHLGLMRPGVTVIRSTNLTELYEQMIHVSQDDVVIGISFPRYSMRTLKLMEFANNRNASVITLTDSILSPMNLYSSCNLVAGMDPSPLVFSPANAFSLLHALLLKVATIREDAYISNLETLEEIGDDYYVDGMDDIDPLEDSIRYRNYCK